MTHQPISVLALQSEAKGKQEAFATIRKRDITAALAYIAELEQRCAATPWAALRAIAFGDASEDDYKALEGWLFDNEPEVEHAGH